MLKDTKSLGNNKAPACESRGFVLKKEGVLFDTPSCFYGFHLFPVCHDGKMPYEPTDSDVIYSHGVNVTLRNWIGPPSLCKPM